MPLSPATIARIFPDHLPTYEEIEERYKGRVLPEGARVTRFAPSPTGFLHIGGVMTALMSERMAHQSGGVFFLRLEDTDQKREVEGAKDLILRSLAHFGVLHDEGPVLGGGEHGAYGPYTQSERKSIYHAYIKYLLEKGDAYVCFATPEELEQNIKNQMTYKEPLGYWGPYAIWREKSEEEVVAQLDSGTAYVIRMRSPGNKDRKIRIKDMIRGTLEFPENINDVVIMKGDFLPTYHFAHAVDDHVMGTTHVVRSDEWIPSLPMHMQLFSVLGFEAPTYCHVAPIQKMEGASRRKLSKRKDPEANVEFYQEEGYPARAVIEYVLNLANSKFEDWRRAHPKDPYTQYLFDPKNVNNSGSLLDFVKLDSVSSNLISRMDTQEVWAELLAWSQTYDHEFYEVLLTHADRAKAFLSIERDTAVPRKDIVKWSHVRGQMEFIFDDWFYEKNIEYAKMIQPVFRLEAIRALQFFKEKYDSSWTQEEWLEELKKIATQLGFAANDADIRSFFIENKAIVGETELEFKNISDKYKIPLSFLKLYYESWNQTPTLLNLKEELRIEVKAMFDHDSYASSPKDLKDPSKNYRGHFGSIAMVLRIAITGSTRSPELSQVMKVLGKEESLKRLERMMKALER